MHVETQMGGGRSLRTHTVKGLVNLPEFSSLLAAVYTSAEFDPSQDSLWDVREADFSAVTPHEIRVLADFVRVNWAEKGKNRAAIVVSGLSDFGVSRMYEHILGPAATGKVKVFRNIKTAWDWIEGKLESVIQTSVKQPVTDANPPN